MSAKTCILMIITVLGLAACGVEDVSHAEPDAQIEEQELPDTIGTFYKSFTSYGPCDLQKSAYDFCRTKGYDGGSITSRTSCNINSENTVTYRCYVRT